MSTTPKDIAFNNKSKNRDHNIYTEEYYGGADCFIYIGKTRYENISALQFQVRETVKPIYGYSSRVYDDIAIGTRIVQGVIKVPVQNVGSADALTDSTNNGTYYLTNKSTTSIPDWVYKYKPAANAVGTPNIGYVTTDANNAIVAKVQNALAKTYPSSGITVSGVMDYTTKQAIADYKQDNNLVVNTNLDGELVNRLISTENNVVHARQATALRYSPNNVSTTFYNVSANARLVIQKVIDDDWVLVQVDTGSKGYIRKGDYY